MVLAQYFCGAPQTAEVVPIENVVCSERYSSWFVYSMCVSFIPSVHLSLSAGVSTDDVLDDDNAPLMILEYMPYGDLHAFLENNR